MSPIYLAPSDPPLKVVCAWCPDFVPAPPTDGTEVTHGICATCLARLKREEEEAAAEREDADDDRDELAGAECGANCGYCGRCS